jgi:uncharacterized protein YkwD
MEWLRRLATVLAAAAVLAGTGMALAAPGGAAKGNGPVRHVDVQRTLESQILAEINRVRAARGLTALRDAGGLCSSAGAHSREMLAHGYFDHESFGGGAFWQRIKRYYPSAGYHRWLVGEALLWVSPTVDAKTAVRDWLDDPEHRRILLGSGWRDIGVSALHATSAPGEFENLELTVVTADFGVRAR